ncbi:MAG: sugar ABC transporter permease [Anaerolineae bacterium]
MAVFDNSGQQTQQADRFSLKQKEAFVGYAMAAPALLLIFLFLIVPTVLGLGFAFTNQRLISPNPTQWVGLRNFENLLSMRTFTIAPETDPETGAFVRDEEGNYVYPRLRNFTRNEEEYPELQGFQELTSWQSGSSRVYILAKDAVFIRAIINTATFVIVVVPVQAGLALILALLVNQQLAGINIFRTIYFMPVVLSLIIVSFLWRFIYDGENGMLNSVLGFVSFGAIKPIDWLGQPSTALPAVIIVSVWQGVGFHMVIWLSGLQTIPAVLYEAADVAGANAWQKFRYVTWGSLRGTAVLIFVVITIQAWGLFAQIDAMTGGGPLDATQTIVFQAVRRAFDQQDIAGGSAISLVLFVIVITISLIQQYLTRERNV